MTLFLGTQASFAAEKVDPAKGTLDTPVRFDAAQNTNCTDPNGSCYKNQNFASDFASSTCSKNEPGYNTPECQRPTSTASAVPTNAKTGKATK